MFVHISDSARHWKWYVPTYSSAWVGWFRSNAGSNTSIHSNARESTWSWSIDQITVCLTTINMHTCGNMSSLFFWTDANTKPCVQLFKLINTRANAKCLCIQICRSLTSTVCISSIVPPHCLLNKTLENALSSSCQRTIRLFFHHLPPPPPRSQKWRKFSSWHETPQSAEAR